MLFRFEYCNWCAIDYIIPVFWNDFSTMSRFLGHGSVGLSRFVNKKMWFILLWWSRRKIYQGRKIESKMWGLYSVIGRVDSRLPMLINFSDLVRTSKLQKWHFNVRGLCSFNFCVLLTYMYITCMLLKLYIDICYKS